MTDEIAQEDHVEIKELLGDKLSTVSFDFFMDQTLMKYITNDNKWILLLSYQRGYAKAMEDKEYQ